MPKRKSAPSLERLCLENVAKNMQSLWVKDCTMNDNLGMIHQEPQGPFSKLASYFLQEVLQIMREKKLLTVAAMHVLLLPQLKALNLGSQKVGKDIAQIIRVRCKNLSTLILDGCNQIPADTLVDLVKALPCVRKLSLAATQCNTQVLSTIRSFCPELIELGIMSCIRLTPISLLHLVYDPMTGSYSCQSLQSLNVEGLLPAPICQMLHGVLVFVLLALPGLEYLGHHRVVQAVCLIHDQQFHNVQMPTGFPSLEEVARYRTSIYPKEESNRFILDLKQIYGVPDSYLPKVRAVCPNLSEVSVIPRNSCGLNQHLLQWHSLAHLIIGGWEGRDLMDLLPVAADLGTQLKTLSLDGFTFKDELTFHTLLSYCPNLQKFESFFHSPERHGRNRQSDSEATYWDLSLPPLKFHQLSKLILVYTGERNGLPSQHVVLLKNIFVSVFNHSPCLDTLNLICLPFSLDEVFQMVLKPPSTALQGLQELLLLQVQISIHTINMLLSSENQLSVLTLRKCSNLSQMDYNELLQRVKKENLELVIKWE